MTTSDPSNPVPRDSAAAVDDVRRAREAIAAEHHGDLSAHMAETNRIFESLRQKLGLKLRSPTKSSDQAAKG